jgi:PhoPQ-activated pathogenicity-related protein
MITVNIMQVPNCEYYFPSDPDLNPKDEDSLIAWAWKQFHEEPDNFDWLPHLPMTKAAMQSMRAAKEFINDELKVADVESFVVVGESKRGWTAFLTGLA